VLALYVLASMIIIADAFTVKALDEKRGSEGQAVVGYVAVCLPVALALLYGLALRPFAVRRIVASWNGWYETAGLVLLWLVTPLLAFGVIRVLWS
jgi:hypothetical protein